MSCIISSPRWLSMPSDTQWNKPDEILIPPMDYTGFTDSCPSLPGTLRECPICHTALRIAHGLCLGCLLHTAVGVDDSDEAADFATELDSVAVADTHWRLGNYEIIEEIGRGGMGVIYRARQRHSRRIVALKRVLSYHTDSRETLARFRREAEAAASLDHPNILPIYEVGESDEGVPFFSMKYAPGGSLQEIGPTLRDKPREVVRLIAKVTRAVQSAHRQGILHRDLKPGNILLDGWREPLVSDFGLAKWLDTSTNLTRTLTIFGTPGYIAPEQAEGPAANLKPAADVYSLGAMLFDLLAGRPPFLGEHALAVIRQAAEKPAPKLRSLVRQLDRDLETICARCLEREPDARYRSAGDLAEDLERWLEGRPIIARPVLPPVRLWRWSKRNPQMATSVLACFALGTAAALWQIQGRGFQTSLRREKLAAHSVTVLPFLDLDTAKADESIANALAQNLQANLSRFGPVRITSMAHGGARWAGTVSLGDMNDANREFKARAFMTGSKRIVNGKIRLSIRLMNAATGDIVFTKLLETTAGGGSVAVLEQAIEPTIRSLLDARDWSTIAPAARDPGMRNPAARDLIISGRQLMFRDTIADYDRSIQCLEKAVHLEPGSAMAHAYLSSTLSSRAHFAPDPQVLNRAEQEAREALRLEPDLPVAHRTIAGVLYQRNQFADALEEQLQAIEVGGPEEHVASFRGMTLINVGRPDRALDWLEMANHWAALPGSYEALVGDCWSLLADDDRAEASYRRAMDLRPEIPDGWIGLCHLRLLQGDSASARKLFEEHQSRSQGYYGFTNDNYPIEMRAQIEFFSHRYNNAERLYTELARSHPAGGSSSYGAMSYQSALGRIRQALGDEAAARSMLEERLAYETARSTRPDNPAHLYIIAAIESSLGHFDAALQHLRAAVSAGWIDYRSLRLDPRFDAIAGDPRFSEIISALTANAEVLRRQTGQPITMATIGEEPSP